MVLPITVIYIISVYIMFTPPLYPLPRLCTLYPASEPFIPIPFTLIMSLSCRLSCLYAAVPFPPPLFFSRRLSTLYAASVPFILVPFTLPLSSLCHLFTRHPCALCTASVPFTEEVNLYFWVDAFLQSDLHYLLSFRSVVQPPSYQCPSSTY